ncbi:MAG: hypothetical protein LBV09_08260 [Deferribacteraceae bacterium]|jgi:tRNA nucleotidyltransferase/poly(A) polymerase|nr:hypothetical protein [Deferribacteraceae bacterium]
MRFPDKVKGVIFDSVRRAAEVYEVYLVGGAVRDIVRGEFSTDLDFVVINGSYEKFAQKLSKILKSHCVHFKDNIRIPFDSSYIDISAPRGETIEQDLLKRDFTINNLAMSVDGELIGDPADIIAKIITPVHDEIFDDDPLRILRGFRQAANLDYTLSDRFLELAKLKLPLLPTIADERINDELKKLSSKRSDHTIYCKMQEMGVWQAVLGFTPNIDHLDKIFDIDCGDEDRYALFLAALGGFPRGVSNYVERCTNSLINGLKAFREDGDLRRKVWEYRKNFEFLASFSHAMGVDMSASRVLYAQMVDIALDGHDILQIAARVAPELRRGRWFADILDECNFQLAFKILNSREEALIFAETEVKKICI